MYKEQDTILNYILKHIKKQQCKKYMLNQWHILFQIILNRLKLIQLQQAMIGVVYLVLYLVQQADCIQAAESKAPLQELQWVTQLVL